MTVWAHHMFATGQVLLPFFAFLSFLIAVPTGVKFFNWIGTMWKGQLTFETPMLFAIGFLVTFLLGGLTGVLLASPPVDFHTHDSYFVVAHFHYVLFGTIVFAAFAGVYFWFPKMTGRLLDERLGKVHFWTMFLGFHATFLVQHWLGNRGHAPPVRRLPAHRRLHHPATPSPPSARSSSAPPPCSSSATCGSPTGSAGWWTSTIPWGFGNSLEWATQLPAAAAQLRPDAPDPLRAAGVRPQVRPQVADLGRDLRQGDAREAEGGDTGRSETAVDATGARDIEVPRPESSPRRSPGASAVIRSGRTRGPPHRSALAHRGPGGLTRAAVTRSSGRNPGRRRRTVG